jgi:SSS family solute:Na+ symporter
LSSIAFPHISIFCLTAEKMQHFKKTVIFYPLCILAIWMPCVYLGVAANQAKDVPQLQEKIDARRTLATQGAQLTPEARNDLRQKMAADDVVLLLLGRYAPLWLAGLLGAGIMAAVMASDSQILALSTMFTQDLFAFYGGRRRFGELAQVYAGRAFVVAITLVAYIIALQAPPSIFDLAVQYAFSGFAALSPLIFAALFWRSSTKWGAAGEHPPFTLASVAAVAIFSMGCSCPSAGAASRDLSAGGIDLLARTPGGTTICGFLPVVPMTIFSALLMRSCRWLLRSPASRPLPAYFPK